MIQLNTPFGKIFFLNETNEEEMESNSTEFYYLAAITSSNVIISVFCLLYIILKLTLNKFIKEILSVMAIQNIICSTIMTISTAVMINLRGQTFWTCQSLVTSMMVLSRSHSVLTPLVSIVRYAMASKVESIQDYNSGRGFKLKYIYAL
jgi:lysylphosphatidylglycerol synthetase-like protein (DUF2156 family)